MGYDYLIVGSGHYEQELKKFTRTLGLESHITFVGYTAHEELSPFYALCDVFVLISRDLLDKPDMEGFGLVFLEANLFGKPVLIILKISIYLRMSEISNLLTIWHLLILHRI